MIRRYWSLYLYPTSLCRQRMQPHVDNFDTVYCIKNVQPVISIYATVFIYIFRICLRNISLLILIRRYTQCLNAGARDTRHDYVKPPLPLWL